MTREWFTTYCQNAAANVLDKDGKIRFTYNTLKFAIVAAAEHNKEGLLVGGVLNLHDNIIKLCDVRNGKQVLSENDEYALLLTLTNIHAAYLMLSGLWKEEPAPQPDKDYCGFEIF